MSGSNTSSNNSEEQNLKDKLHFLEKVSDFNPNLLYIIQLNPHKIVYINNVINNLLGHDPAFMIEKGPEIFQALIHPEDYKRWLANLENCFSSEKETACEVEIRVRTTEQGWKWFKVKDKIFERDSNGKVTHVIGTAFDIHDQKLWKEKQREEHRRFRNAQEIGHIGSYERKLPGDYLTYSAEFYRILGLEPRDEELHIDEFLSHVHPDDRESYIKAIEHTYATGDPLDIVTRAIRPDGSIRHIHRRAAILKNEAGIPVLGYGTGQDITNRIIAEEERERLENLMQSTEMVAGTGSYEADLATGKIYFSKGFFRLFGYEPNEFEPTREWIDKHSHPDDVSRVNNILEEAVSKNQSYTYNRRIFRKDGQERIIESQGSVVVNEQGEPKKLIGLVQDVTARKKAEEELLRSEARSRNLLKVLQDVPDSYLVLTPDFMIDMASDAYLTEIATQRDEIIGRNILETFPDNPDDPNATGVKNLRASLQKVLSTKKPHRMPIQQYDVRDQDGIFEEKYWSATNTPVINAQGEVDFIIHRVLNITDVVKKQTAEKGISKETEILKTSLEEIKLQAARLKESRSLLQTIFDASPNSIALYKILRNENEKVEDFEFLMLNAYNTEKLGVSRDIIGRKMTEEFPEVRNNNILKEAIETAETGVPGDFEIHYRGDGLNHWFHFKITRLEDQLLITTEDITERKKSDEIIQQMLNGSLSAITILESIRDEDEKIVDFVFKGANKAAEKINAMSSEKMVGNTLLNLYPGVKDVFLDTYIEVVETGKPLRVLREYTYEHFHNWFDVSAVKMGDGFLMTYNDITEQKEAEQELIQLKEELAQRAEDRYRKIINSMDEGFCLIETIFNEHNECVDYKYLETNPVFEEQSGLKDAIGKTIKEMAPSIESYWLRYYGNVAKTGVPLRFEDYSVPLEKWFDIYAFRLDEQEKNHVGVIFKDITARKEAEERQTFLLELNDTLRPLVDPEEIQVTAMKILGRHLEVNRAFYSEPLQNEETLKSNPGYMDGVERAPDEVNLSAFKSEIIKRFLSGETLVFNDTLEGPHVLKENQEKVADAMQVRASIAVPLIRNGMLVAAIRIHHRTPRKWTAAEVSLVEEVSRHTWEAVERARAENALRESEQKFRDLVEASALAIWETDAGGVVVTDSPTWRAFTGQSFKDWKGYGWLDAIHPDDRENTFNHWRQAVDAREKFDTEFRLIGLNGESRWTNVKAAPIMNLEGKIIKWIGMNLDIHQMKMTEVALLKSKNEAEAASRAKEDFVSTMSHEIRTPLNAVIGLTNLLLDKNPRTDQKENLNSLSFSAQNLLSLINDILDFSKLEAGKGDVEENVLDLSNLISSLQQLYKPQAINHNSHFNIYLGKDIPKHIVTDQLKLSQILQNLVSNAVKFTRNGSINFTVEVGRREEDILWLDFAVQDTGIGVPREKLAHIFEKFSQAESSTVRQYGGTGLGLTITKLLLELMGSEIKVESQVGKGSRFYFSLPVKEGQCPPQEEEVEIQQEEINDLSHIRLLLVEDVEINRNILIQFFGKWWKLRPEEAVNGQEAFKMAQQRSYDLILMDVRMPIMDGYEATRLIRNIKGYDRVPILALTADKNQEVQQEQHATQFDNLLTKPFDPAQLKRRILHHLELKKMDLKNAPGIVINGEDKNNPQPATHNNDAGKEEVQLHYSVEKYKSLAGENTEVLKKLIKTAIQSFKIYKEEFIPAATNEDIEAISNLIHKNTVTLHYIEAETLKNLISQYREYLGSTEKPTLGKQKIENILAEFDVVIAGLEDFIKIEN